jgi:hypothetical protein
MSISVKLGEFLSFFNTLFEAGDAYGKGMVLSG